MKQREPYGRRLPEGFAALSADLGAILRRARKGEAGAGYGHKQGEIAKKIGVDRITLSRIERGVTIPQMETLTLLLDVLHLQLSDVALTGANKRPPLIVAQSAHGNREILLGRKLRRIRKSLKLSLETVARASGVSIAQLSRIERGQSRHSHLINDASGCDDMTENKRSVAFTNPVLQNLYEGDWAPAGEIRGRYT